VVLVLDYQFSLKNNILVETIRFLLPTHVLPPQASGLKNQHPFLPNLPSVQAASTIKGLKKYICKRSDRVVGQ